MPALSVTIKGPLKWRLFSRGWWRFTFMAWVKRWFTPAGWRHRRVLWYFHRHPECCWSRLCDYATWGGEPFGDCIRPCKGPECNYCGRWTGKRSGLDGERPAVLVPGAQEG